MKSNRIHKDFWIETPGKETKLFTKFILEGDTDVASSHEHDGKLFTQRARMDNRQNSPVFRKETVLKDGSRLIYQDIYGSETVTITGQSQKKGKRRSIVNRHKYLFPIPAIVVGKPNSYKTHVCIPRFTTWDNMLIILELADIELKDTVYYTHAKTHGLDIKFKIENLDLISLYGSYKNAGDSTQVNEESVSGESGESLLCGSIICGDSYNPWSRGYWNYFGSHNGYAQLRTPNGSMLFNKSYYYSSNRTGSSYFIYWCETYQVNGPVT